MKDSRKLLLMSVCITIACITWTSVSSSSSSQQPKKLIIVGGGIVGAMEAYYAAMDAKKNNTPLCITICEQNEALDGTTTSHIVPSFTPDEILSVIPRGQELVKKLQILFSNPGGIRVDDVPGVSGTASAQQFQQQAEQYSLDEVGHDQRTKHLLALGKMSMDMWQQFYEEADDELKEILKASNFNACYEPTSADHKTLRNGYRIDLIYNVPNAHDRAEGMKKDYETLGYKQCAILTPAQVMELDPFLTDFCRAHATQDASGNLAWHHDAVALWRPGGCLDSQVFLPKLYAYLTKHMGTYTNAQGSVENCFCVKYNAQVTGLDFDRTQDGRTIVCAIRCANGCVENLVASDGSVAECVLCPGESVGTLKKLGLQEPAYAGFAGASLMLTIDIPEGKVASCQSFNHCMEVHQEGVVLAWQARYRDNKIFIGVAGTKAFYSDQKPTKDQDFAKNRNLLQLNMVNNVLPEFISWALGRDTKNQTLTAEDLYALEDKGVATRWAGTRAVVYDGFPSLGCVYKDNDKVANARCTTHLGSGGVSFAPAAIAMSRHAMETTNKSDSFTQAILQYGASTRTA
jgi:hypothetical protein